MLPFTLAAVHYHPQPVDDCPCFEDAIAVLAVVLGTFTGHWYWARQPFPALCFQRLYGEESAIKAIFVGFLRVVVGKSLFWLPRLPFYLDPTFTTSFPLPEITSTNVSSSARVLSSCHRADCLMKFHLPSKSYSSTKISFPDQNPILLPDTQVSDQDHS